MHRSSVTDKLAILERFFLQLGRVIMAVDVVDWWPLSRGVNKAPSTYIRIFSNPQLFLPGYGYRPHVSGEFGSESRKK